jgi:hypothetical protein
MFCPAQETIKLLPSCDKVGRTCEVRASRSYRRPHVHRCCTGECGPGILLGAELNAEIEHQTAGDSTGGGSPSEPGMPALPGRRHRMLTGWVMLDGLAKALSPALSLALAGVTGTAAQGCHFRPVLHKKTTIRSTNGRASRDVSWCTAPTSPGAAWGRQVLAMTAYAAPALNGALLENNFSLSRQEVLPSPHDGRAAAPCHLSRTPDPMRL